MSRITISDGSSWPLPSLDAEDRSVEWALRYAEPTREEMLQAAAIISAYGGLIEASKTKRDLVCRDICKELEEES